MMAPFFDDLDDNEEIEPSNVWFWTNNQDRVIVEWDNIAYGQHDEDCVLDVPGSCPRHTFQLILDDSNVGNGEIIFQYKEAESWYVDDHGSTVGIEAPDKDSGTQYLFNLSDQDAPLLHNELVVKFSDNSYTTLLGDLNSDDGWNVADIVILANCILADNCDEIENGCAGLLSDDLGWNVQDIVLLATCILAENCDEIENGRGRVDDATLSRLIMKDNMVSIEADGFIGGVQMTLQHGDDFRVKMTERALIADYLTTGNETRLLIVTPETYELFSYSGDFEITELIVANSHAEVSASVSASLPLADSFSLSQAYPNPFNPVTSLVFNLPEDGNVMVRVYNLKGQVVKTLLSGHRAGGTYNLTWDASDAASGMYFITLSASDTRLTQKVLLLK